MSVAEGTMRRPLRSRQTRWAAALAESVARRGVTPNQISLASVGSAALAGGCLALAPASAAFWGSVLLVAAAVCIQLRLLCNLLDGMVAIEGGLKTRSGEIFNDLPDRLADLLIFVGAGFAIGGGGWGGTLGWAAALLAILTAYVRVLGVSAGAGAHFEGPMAKPQRMALMTAACLTGAIEVAAGGHGRAMAAALAVIVVGCVVTIVRRTWRILRELEAR